MTAQLTDIQLEILVNAAGAFEAFCNDMAGMFGIEASCVCQEAVIDNFNNIKKQLSKTTAVHPVKSEGIIDGIFYLVFDSKALFILAGSVVMLPKNRILDNVKLGGLKDAENLKDAIGEVGNLLVGSWDRVYRDNIKDHKHFVKAASFIGEFQNAPKQADGIPAEEQFNVVKCEINIGDFPACSCFALFPESLWTPKKVTEKETKPEDAKTQPQDSAKPVEPVKKEPEVQPPQSENAQKPAETTPPAPQPPTVQQSPVEQIAEEKPAHTEATPAENTQPQTTQQSPREQHSEDKIAYTDDQYGDDLLEITAQDVMNHSIAWAGPEDSVEQVLSQMQGQNSSYVLIGENGNCQGIVSRSNIDGAISPFLKPIFAKWRRPLDDATLQIKVKWIMSAPVHAVPGEATLYSVMNTMCNFGGRCLPVLGADGKVVGIITVFDIFKALMNNDSEEIMIGATNQSSPLI